MSFDLDELVQMLREQVSKVAQCDLVDDTCVLEGDTFLLSFTFTHALFEIRNIEAVRQGHGRKVVMVIHEYCDSHALDVYASNVKDTAIGFWQRMGYTEADGGEFFRVL